MKRLFAVIAAGVFLTGCSSGVVIGREYIRGVSVEKGKTGISFYGEEGEKYSALCSAEDICKAGEIRLGKSIFTGHTELIILGDCDPRKELEYFLNEWKVSPSCKVAYGGDKGTYILMEQDAERLVQSLSKAVEKGEAPESGIVEVLGKLINEEGKAEIPVMDEGGFSGKTKVIS